MISTDLAGRLRDAGLVWRPRDGDRFRIDSEQLSDEVFTVSTMTIEARHYPTGTILGFNGTTEWALDSVRIEDTLWLPREDQLRDLLGPAFSVLRHEDDAYTVDVTFPDGAHVFDGPEPAEAYGRALLALIRLSSD